MKILTMPCTSLLMRKISASNNLAMYLYFELGLIRLSDALCQVDDTLLNVNNVKDFGYQTPVKRRTRNGYYNESIETKLKLTVKSEGRYFRAIKTLLKQNDLGSFAASPEFDWHGTLTPQMLRCFEDNGYFVVRNFLDKEEITQLWKVLEEPDGILKHSYMTYEADGRRIQRTLCMYPGSDVSGILARSEKVVTSCEKLLGYEVYHWCSMFMFKDAKVGGEHLWHQDYGYWYNNGCLYPDMMTAWMPLVSCKKDNSCKQVLRGSHKLGRLDHIRAVSGQMAADNTRVEQVRKICKHEYLEMEPGDAFFHHGNLLHRSGRNISDNPRMAFMCCYNAAHNSPYINGDHPKYNKIQKVSDGAIKECKNYRDFSGKVFLDFSVNNMKRKEPS